MSKTLSDVAVTEFDSEVKHAFQGVGMLRSAVTQRNGVVGDTYNFRKMGKGLANQKATQDDVTPMDVSHSMVAATLTNWNAPEYTDIFDQAEVNFDEKVELAQVIAGALGRRQDQIIIDALDAATPGTTDVGTGVGADTGLNKGKMVRAMKELVDKGVPQDGRLHAAVSASGLEDLLNVTEVTSSDYVQIQALITGEIKNWMGFIIHIIETRDEGGLNLSGSDRDCWAWHESAIGLATSPLARTEVNYIAQKTSWLCNGVMKCGAAIRDTDGIVKITITE